MYDVISIDHKLEQLLHACNLLSLFKNQYYSLIPQRKCERYWNEDIDHPLEPGRDLSVKVTSIMGYANYVVKEITLTNVSGL